MMAANGGTEDLRQPDRGDPMPPEPAASVLDLILMRVRLRARRRAAWLEHLWGSSSEGRADMSVTAGLDDRDTPWAESEWFETSEVVEPENRGLERVEALLAGDAGERLARLEALFRLSQPESDLLQACLAVAVDADLGSVFAYLQRHSGRVYATELLAARLFGYGRQAIWGADSPLAVWALVSAAEAPAGEGAPIVCDPQILRWLQGSLRVDAPLVGVVREVERHEPLGSWPIEKTVQFLRRSMERESGVRILLEGPDGSGRRTLAAAVAARFGLPTLAVDTGLIADERWPECFMRAQRLAMLGGTALVWHGRRLQRRWRTLVASAPLQFIACEETELIAPEEDLIDHRIELPSPSVDERRALWARHVPESAAWPEEEREALVSRHRLVVGDIVAMGRRRPASPREASALCREQTRHRLGDLGRLLDSPFTWDDMIVPERLREGLEDFAFEARERAVFWESAAARRLFPRGKALVGLLTGPPGTGKTMAAQVIAAELELDLFRIDLATAVSKYIGETAKNLGRIFARAARMNAVLLFDEADALFSRRTEVRDAHDRYANTDTNYLLQLLEDYRGIALLATNKKNNIDPAFTRRVRYVFDFPRPEPAHRQLIWTRVITEMSDADTARELGGVIDSLASGVETSGAQIKNSILASLFIARRSHSPLGMSHLLRGLERELDKEGRALGRRERERLLSHA